MHTAGTQHSWGTCLAIGTGIDQCGHIHENMKATCTTSHVSTLDYTAGHFMLTLQTGPSLLPSAMSSGLGGHRVGAQPAPLLSASLWVRPTGHRAADGKDGRGWGCAMYSPRFFVIHSSRHTGATEESKFRPRPVSKACALNLRKSKLVMGPSGS